MLCYNVEMRHTYVLPDLHLKLLEQSLILCGSSNERDVAAQSLPFDCCEMQKYPD